MYIYIEGVVFEKKKRGIYFPHCGQFYDNKNNKKEENK